MQYAIIITIRLNNHFILGSCMLDKKSIWQYITLWQYVSLCCFTLQCGILSRRYSLDLPCVYVIQFWYCACALTRPYYTLTSIEDIVRWFVFIKTHLTTCLHSDFIICILRNDARAMNSSHSSPRLFGQSIFDSQWQNQVIQLASLISSPGFGSVLRIVAMLFLCFWFSNDISCVNLAFILKSSIVIHAVEEKFIMQCPVLSHI